jgi:transcriptional regulator with XRE-family HTH domain
VSFPTALRTVRQKRGLSQAAVARMGYVSEQMIQAAEAGRRRLTPDVMALIADATGEPQLLMEAGREVTGGAFVSPYLDGDLVDLHRSSVLAKLREEIGEAAVAVDNLDLVNRPRQDDHSRRQVREVLLQILDVHVAIDHVVAIVAPECRIGIADLFAEHDQKLRSRGFLRREGDRCSGKQTRATGVSHQLSRSSEEA